MRWDVAVNVLAHSGFGYNLQAERAFVQPDRHVAAESYEGRNHPKPLAPWRTTAGLRFTLVRCTGLDITIVYRNHRASW